jgi:prepilin-type N-terminal cleavage/methylation domain-containing protein
MKKGFTLLEVLVAAGILFIVGSATVGLTNSIIQGTAQTSSETVANRLASEGLELVAKKRDDTVKAAVGDDPWFAYASAVNQYGWYAVSPNGTLTATGLNLVPLLSVVTTATSLPVEVKQSVGNQDYYRLICIEAVGATVPTAANDTQTHCNTKLDGSAKDDGNRNAPSLTTCAAPAGTDTYCEITTASLSRNRVGTLAIPPGNAVKIRSVVIWQDKELFRVSDVATFLTNWKSTLDVQ